MLKLVAEQAVRASVQVFPLKASPCRGGDVKFERLSFNEKQQGQWYFPMDKPADTAILRVGGSPPGP